MSPRLLFLILVMLCITGVFILTHMNTPVTSLPRPAHYLWSIRHLVNASSSAVSNMVGTIYRYIFQKDYTVKKVVLFWSPRGRSVLSEHGWTMESCPEWKNKCELMYDSSYLSVAHMVVFTLRTLPSNLTKIYSLHNVQSQSILRHSDQSQNILRHRDQSQRWVIYSRESPQNEPNHKLLVSQFDGIFNFTAHYSKKADVYYPYGRCYSKNKTVTDNQIIHNKTRLIAWAVGDCHPFSERDKYVWLLRQHIHVDIFGACGSLRAKRDTFDELLTQYKFYLSFENSFCAGYITEKFYKIVSRPELQVIPIVLGSGSYKDLLPPGSYIDIRDYSSPAALAKHLKYLDGNNSAFMEYFRWHDSQACEETPWNLQCLLCDRAHQILKSPRIISKQQLQYVFGEDNCTLPEKYYWNVEGML